MNEAKLKACPWCGGEASATGVIRYSKSHEAWWQDGTQIREAYFVNCMKCGVTNQGLCGHQTPDIAITRWNERAGGRQPEVAPNAEAIASSLTLLVRR